MTVTQLPTATTQNPTRPNPRVKPQRTSQPAPSNRVVGDVLRSEWTRLRTVRSTYWTLLGAAIAMVGLSAIVCSVEVAQFDKLTAADKATFNPVTFSLVGGGLGQLGIGVLGVLIITNEYASGMIRTTFAATPQRLTVLAAKATVFGIVTFFVTTLSAFGAFFVGQAILSRKDLGFSIGAPGAVRSVVGAGLYLSVLGLLALGLGTLIRKTAGAIAALFGVLFIVPVIVSLLPSSINGMQKYLPSNAGQEIMFGSGQHSSDVLSPWVGFGVFCLWAIVILGVASVVLVKRDA
jgi:ABC-2 type transport system permease protein